MTSVYCVGSWQQNTSNERPHPEELGLLLSYTLWLVRGDAGAWLGTAIKWTNEGLNAAVDVLATSLFVDNDEG
jgi:hypothetical protein